MCQGGQARIKRERGAETVTNCLVRCNSSLAGTLSFCSAAAHTAHTWLTEAEQTFQK